MEERSMSARKEKINTRSRSMANSYLDGRTLQEIGDDWGVTRERVRQIISFMGISRDDGGRAERSRRARARKEEKRDLKYLKEYDMTRDEYYSIRGVYGAGPVRAYTDQRINAKNRGIEWRFTFNEWWKIWDDSGCWEDRGRGFGYVMSRPGDVGPYSADNVRIIPADENSREYKVRYWEEVRTGKRDKPSRMNQS